MITESALKLVTFRHMITYSTIENPTYAEYFSSYNDEGEFRIIAKNTDHNANTIQKGDMVWIENSVVGIIDYIKLSENNQSITWSGTLGDGLLSQRYVFDAMEFASSTSEIIISDIFSEITPIPNLNLEFQISQAQQYDISVGPGNFLEILKDLCKQFNLGYRIVKKSGSTGLELTLQIYQGENKSESVILSQKYESLTQFEFTDSVKNEINYVKILGDNDIVVEVTSEGYEDNLTRKEYMLDCRGISQEDMPLEEYQQLLTDEGQRIIDEHKPQTTYSGSYTGLTFIYGQDYNIGDTVTIAGLQGLTAQQIITGAKKQFDKSGAYVQVFIGESQKTISSEVTKISSQLEKISNSSHKPSYNSGTGKFLDSDHTSVAHNDLEHNTSEGIYDSVNGYKNTVTGIGSISNDSVSGGANTAFGQHNTVISNTGSFVFGAGNRLNANGVHNTVGGTGNNVSGALNTVLGTGNRTGNVGRSLVHGAGIIADGLNSSALFGQGHYISGNSSDDHILVTGRGAYAERGTSSPAIGLLFIAAYNGNKVTIDTSGNVQAAGTYGTMGADYAEYFEWEDGNPDNEYRCGMLVSVRRDKIVLADGDDILGVISANASVVGNAYELYWHGKYVTDVYGKIITTPCGEPLISPDFDPERKYIPRSRRKEWAAVGLVGRLIVRDDGSCKVGGYVSAKNGIAVRSDFRTGIKVLRRTDEMHVEIITGGTHKWKSKTL